MAISTSSSLGLSLIDTSIFTTLQAKIDEESTVRDELKNIVDTLSKQGRLTQSILARIHNVPSGLLVAEVLTPAAQALAEQKLTVSTLQEAASKYPFYKYNNIWQRDIQNLISSLQIQFWLQNGSLISVEDVGGFFNGESTCSPLWIRS